MPSIICLSLNHFSDWDHVTRASWQFAPHWGQDHAMSSRPTDLAN
jgi:hypothetical protein